MLALILGLQLMAQTQYPMHVVTEARVSKQNKNQQLTAMSCQSSTLTTNSKKQLNWVGSQERKPELILNLSENSQIIATRNTDDSYLNSVTLWLALKTQKQVEYFVLTEIDMENYELPNVKLANNILIIQANILVADENEENEFLKGIPTIQRSLYQTINLTSINKKTAHLQILTCK